MSKSSALESDLVAALGQEAIVDESAAEPYVVDWTGRFAGRPSVVVAPRTSEQLRLALGVLADRQARYVVQGGNTGLVGGGVPDDGEAVLALRHFDATISIDESSREALVGAGATLAALQAAAADAGLDYPVDFASRTQATIGGTIATNAAGLRTLRHGPTNERVLGLQAILVDGSAVDSFDDRSAWVDRLVGSEGIFGVVTGARLGLVEACPERAVGLVATADVAAAVALSSRARELEGLESFEFVGAEAAELLAEQDAVHPPLAGKALVVLEVASQEPCLATLERFLSASTETRSYEVASDEAGRSAIWRWREGIPGAISAAGIPHKFDVAIAPPAAARCLDDVRRFLADEPRAQVFAFGHLAEGRLHINVLGLDPHDLRIDDEVFSIVESSGGSVISEHGVGRLKAAAFARSCERRQLSELIEAKSSVDPRGLANSGVVLPRQLIVDPST